MLFVKNYQLIRWLILYRRGKYTMTCPDVHITNNYRMALRDIVVKDLYQGVNVLRSIVALIASSYISNRWLVIHDNYLSDLLFIIISVVELFNWKTSYDRINNYYFILWWRGWYIINLLLHYIPKQFFRSLKM